MPALEPVAGVRVVAAPAALDGARWAGDDVEVLRIAPDEALGIGATGATVDGDPDAIVEPEAAFSVALLDRDELAALAAHTEWPLPVDGQAGTLAQGKVAGVPAKIVVGDPSLLVIQTAYADELERRLGWR
ncbi:MAG TPA: hypothetical protein VID95_00620 [Candidatus Limnocylindrales bacterium]